VIVSITAEAEADLEQIAMHIGEQSPRSALKLVRALAARCESLLDVHVATVGATLRAFGHSETSLRRFLIFLPRRCRCDFGYPYSSRRPRL